MSQTPKRRSGGRQAAGASGRKKSDHAGEHGAVPAASAADDVRAADDAQGAVVAADEAGVTGADATGADEAGVDETADADEAGADADEDRAVAGSASVRLLAGAAIAGLEGVAVAAWGIATCFSGGGNAVLAGLFVLLLAALPLGAAYGLRHARRWSRGPALIMQLLALPVAWTMIKGDGPFVAAGAVLGVLAVAGLVLLANTATTDALGISRTTP